MVILSKAKVVCEYCGEVIRTASVSSGTPKTLVTSVFNLCPKCQKRFVTYNDLANTYAIANCLLKQHIPEQILMRDYVQCASSLVKAVNSAKISDPREIFRQYEKELERLTKLQQQVVKAYNLKYQKFYPLLTCMNITKPQENPLLSYRDYIHRKYKKLYHPR